MKNGQYKICLKADGYSGEGDLSLSDDHGQGHDGAYAVELELHGKGPSLNGIARIIMSPAVVHNSRMPERYSLPMSGVDHEDAFSLIGIGPLGLIVELNAQWHSDLTGMP